MKKLRWFMIFYSAYSHQRLFPHKLQSEPSSIQWPWIKELSDGILASFNTVSDAVNAAIKICEECAASNEK